MKNHKSKRKSSSMENESTQKAPCNDPCLSHGTSTHLFTARDCRLDLLCDHFLFLTVSNLLCGGGHCLLLHLLCFGISAQIFMGCGGSCGDGRCGNIRA